MIKFLWAFAQSTTGRALIAASAAAWFWGGWALLANFQHGWLIALKTAIYHGWLVFFLNLVGIYALEYFYFKFGQTHLTQSIAAFTCTQSITLFLKVGIHVLIGTPELLITLAPGIIVGMGGKIVYLLGLGKLIEAQGRTEAKPNALMDKILLHSRSGFKAPQEITRHPLNTSGLLALGFVVAMGLFLPTLNPYYDLFHNEYYFIACTEQLAFGCRDLPPLSITLLTGWIHLFGDSIYSIRIPPLLAFTALLYLTGLIAQRMGASARVQLLAAASIVPVFGLHVIFSHYSMHSFEVCFWSLGFFLLIELIRTQNPKIWLLLGVVAGLSFLNQYSSLIFFAALGLGLLLSPQRHLITNKYCFFSIVIMLLMILPFIYRLDSISWTSFPVYQHPSSENIDTSLLQAIIEQFMALNFSMLILVVPAILYLLKFPAVRKYQAVLWTFCLIMIAMLFSNQSRPHLIIGVYPVMLAIGMTALSFYLLHFKLKRFLIGFLIIPYVSLLLGLPILQTVAPPSLSMQYNNAFGIPLKMQKNSSETGLPLWLSNRIGWQAAAQSISNLYQALPADQRDNTIVVSRQYDFATAIDYYAKRMPLPKAYSGDMSVSLEGSPLQSTTTFITIDFTAEELAPYFNSIELKKNQHCPLCISNHQTVPIFIAHDPKQPFAQIWQKNHRVLDLGSISHSPLSRIKQ